MKFFRPKSIFRQDLADPESRQIRLDSVTAKTAANGSPSRLVDWYDDLSCFRVHDDGRIFILIKGEPAMVAAESISATITPLSSDGKPEETSETIDFRPYIMAEHELAIATAAARKSPNGPSVFSFAQP